MVLAQKQTHRSMEHNREPRNKPSHLWSIKLQQRRQGYKWRKDSLFNKWCMKNWTAMWQRMKLEHFITPSTKMNSKWILKNPKCKTRNSKTSRKNIRRTVFDISPTNICLELSLQAKETKAKINK